MAEEQHPGAPETEEREQTQSAQGAPPPPPPADDDTLAEEPREHARFVNNQYFYGAVNAAGSTFGTSFDAGRSGSGTGPVRVEEVEEALRRYLKPPGFHRALEILRRHRVVVLCGPDGVGRYAGAVALLREVAPDGALPTNLSPALTFAELAAQKFGNAGGYIVRDQLRDANAPAVQQFEVHRLVTALCDRSYLVITVDLGVRPRGQLAELMVDWSAPDLDQLFARCVAELPPEVLATDEARRVREHLPNLTSPREVIRLARLLADGPQHALAALENSEHSRVVRWFDQSPAPHDVLAVAALVFVEGAPEAVYENRVARLCEAFREVSGGGPTPDRDSHAGGLRQTRKRDGTGDMITVRGRQRAGAEYPGAERTVHFTSAGMRELVLRELHDRYGYELWEPMRKWLHEVAALPASELHVRVGLGVAMYSRLAFREVEHVFLDRWSDGKAPERLAAACTLSWIGLDGTNAAAALGITKRWAYNSGPRRAVTAATALGGPLGLRYSSDALRWLWNLAMRTAQIREIACVALGVLFAASADDPVATRRVLNFLHGRLRRSLEPGESQRDRRATFTTVLNVLSAQRPDSDEPVVAAVLRTDAANAARLGGLWAELFCSGPHRRQARRALFRALESLSGDADALPAVRRLGTAIRVVLSQDQWSHLEEELEQDARQRADASDEATFASVLAALRGRHRPHYATAGRIR